MDDQIFELKELLKSKELVASEFDRKRMVAKRRSSNSKKRQSSNKRADFSNSASTILKGSYRRPSWSLQAERRSCLVTVLN